MFSAPEAQAAAGAAVEAAVAVPGAAAAVSAVPRAGRSASAPLPAALEARMQAFQEALSQPRINLKHLKQLAYSGVPDVSGVRSLAWKILLGYLPPQRADWAATLEQKRGQYLQFCRDFACDPAALAAAAESERARAAVADHPLSLEADSAWKRYFQDSEVKEQIDKDVQRTHPDLDFFSGDHPTAVLHRQEMKRALFVYAKLNPGLNYIQGMNELYAPLYYTFSLDLGSARHGSGGSSSGHGGHGDDAVQSGGGSGSLEQQGVGCAEADAFFCFMDLVSECRDHYCKQLDNSSVGIRATLATLQGLLDHHDAEVAEHLRDLQVDVHFFGFRWVALLLTQDFQFPDVMRLWDTLLSDPHGLLDSLLRICVAMVLHLREQLLAADFSTAVKLLQHFPRSTDVSEILRRAHALSAPPHRPSNPLPHRRSTSDNDGTASFTRAGSSGNVI